jgi:YegS/Rv2252/BmrU family lipid kinase
MKYVFIVNPVAGNAKLIAERKEEIAQLCLLHSVECEFLYTERIGHAAELARAAAQEEQPVRIFACGGDGTLSEAANGIAGMENAELGCIPCGSGNDFIKTFAEKEQFLDFENYLFSPSTAIDTIDADGKCCINIASLGLDANICNLASMYIRAGKYQGSKAYDKAMVRSIFGKRANTLKITIDDKETFEGSYMFSLAANGVCYGGGYYGAPMANPCDGQLDFVLIKNTPLLKLPFLIGSYKDGTYVGKRKYRKLATIRRGAKMHIEAKEKAIVNIDGECEAVNSVTFEIRPQSLRFVLPRGYNANDN